jgi:hypothetical protein
LEKLGAEMGRDPEQLADWLTGRHNPCRRNQKEIEEFLSDKLDFEIEQVQVKFVGSE